MIEFIRGIVEYIGEEFVVVENNNIGFKIFTSSNTISKLRLYNEGILYTFMNVREDDISLYGFTTRDELAIFKLLITVNGVGPKVALSILSIFSVNDLRMAVISDDAKAISKANGVGGKTAQKIILELKDKMKIEDVFEDNQYMEVLPDITSNDIITETTLALTSLGYSQMEAMKAIKKVDGFDTMGVEDLLKAALKKIM